MKRLPCLVALLALAAGAMAEDSAVVLMYHRFGEDHHPSTSIRAGQFEAHLDHLATGGFTVIELARLLAFLDGEGERLPTRSVVLTIDDAYRSVYEVAYPRLKAYGFPFTVFVATEPVDQGLDDYMSWAEMREMAAHGASYANHGAAHLSLIERLPGETDSAWRARVDADVERGRARLAQELTLVGNAFAYPYGEYATGLADRLAAMGYIAFGQQSGAVGASSDRRALPRFPMAEAFGDLSEFRTKVASLPLPVVELAPWEPVTAKRRPAIEVTLGQSDARLGELRCYVSGQGRVPVQWLAEGRRFRVAPAADLAPGRARVNCTAPTPAGRYRWFSHPWFVR